MDTDPTQQYQYAFVRLAMCECGHLRLHHTTKDYEGAPCGFYTCTCPAFQWMHADHRAFAAIYIKPLVDAERLIEAHIRDLLETAGSSRYSDVSKRLVDLAQDLVQVRDLIVDAFVT